MIKQTASSERISLGVGLCAIMLAALPRYIAGGHETRQTLVLLGAAAIAAVMAVQWRWLDKAGRQRLPRLLLRLAGLLALGLALVFSGYSLFGTAHSWAVSLSHGATLGLLLYAVTLWRR